MFIFILFQLISFFFFSPYRYLGHLIFSEQQPLKSFYNFLISKLFCHFSKWNSLELCIWFYIYFKIVVGCLMGWLCVVSEEVSQNADFAEYFLSLFKLFYILLLIPLLFLLTVCRFYLRDYFHISIVLCKDKKWFC